MVERKSSRIGEFGLTPEALELISGVFRRHPEVRTAKIFGSRATGSFEDNSDVDLVLWGDLDMHSVGRILGELDELPLPYTFDVQAYKMVKHPPLKRYIDEVGRILYSADSEIPRVTENGDCP